MSKKSIKELTFKNNFMFSAVMLDSENCRGVLERVLGVPIDRVFVDREKSMVYNPEYKGVRLDVYAKTEDGERHFDVEMQVVSMELTKRARYYHDQMDMELLETGVDYERLPDAYVIFICDFDPYGLEKYRYTVLSNFKEDESYEYDDGRHTVFLSTKGKNESEEPAELVKFLKFVGADLEHSRDESDDELVTMIQNSVEKIKVDREMGARYMQFQELLKDEYNAGKADGEAIGLEKGLESILKGILALLSSRSINVSTDEQEKLKSIGNIEVMNHIFELAINVKDEVDYKNVILPVLNQSR